MDGILMVHYLVVEDSQRLKRQRSLETPAAEPARQEVTQSDSLLEQQRKSMIEHQARMHEWFVRQQQQPGLAPLHSPIPFLAAPSMTESTWSPSLPGLLPTDPMHVPNISLPATSDMTEIFADQPPIESQPSITYRHSRLDRTNQFQNCSVSFNV
jgi:hemin uptake protein HemP